MGVVFIMRAALQQVVDSASAPSVLQKLPQQVRPGRKHFTEALSITEEPDW